MSQGEAHARRPTGAARALRWLLVSQVAIAALLAGGDIARVAPSLTDRSGAAPAFDTPVQPGDQTRRYAPSRLLPGRPSLPGVGDMPRRLAWQTAEIDGSPALALSGEIRPGDAERLLTHLGTLDEMPPLATLHSPGGSVADALAIGRELRDIGIATRVGPGAVCLSACPYILAGGPERTISRQARIGVHQHSFGESTILPAFLAVADIQAGQAEVMTFLDEMGVSPLLMAHAMRTPPQEIYILIGEELETLALATALVD